MVTTSPGVLVASAVGIPVSTTVGTGVAGPVVGWGVTGLVPDTWVQPAITMHAIIARKRKISGHLIYIFFFGETIILLYEAGSRFRTVQPVYDEGAGPQLGMCAQFQRTGQGACYHHNGS
jgi:hypothetical protein